MTDETVAQEVTAGVTEAEAVAVTVVDHADQLATTVEGELEKAKTGLSTLQTHSSAQAAGTTISNVIAQWTTFVHNVESALGIYKTAAASSPTPAAPAPEPTPAPEPSTPAS